MQESCSCQWDWDFLQCCLKVNTAIQTLKREGWKCTKPMPLLFWGKTKSHPDKNHLQTGGLLQFIFMSAFFIFQYWTERNISREKWDKSCINVKILEASLRFLRSEESLYTDFHLSFWNMVIYVYIKYLCVIVVGFLCNEKVMPSSRSRQKNSTIQASLGLWISLCALQFSSVAQSCLTLCDPVNCSTPGFPVHHQLPEITQTHVHQVGDAI